MTTGEAIKLLKDNGFEELNQVGSHRKFGKGIHRITIVFHSSPKEIVHRKLEKAIINLIKQIENECNISK